MSTSISGPCSRSFIALTCFRKLKFGKPCNKRNISKTTTQKLPFSLLMLVLQSFRFNFAGQFKWKYSQTSNATFSAYYYFTWYRIQSGHLIKLYNTSVSHWLWTVVEEYFNTKSLTHRYSNPPVVAKYSHGFCLTSLFRFQKRVSFRKRLKSLF